MSAAVQIVGGMTVAGILASTPFGLPMNQIALGTGFAIVGVAGRAAFELQKTAEGTAGSLKVGKILGWVGAGFIGAPFVTVFFLVCLNLANVKSDGIVSLGLLFFGFSGPRMVTWLLNTGISLLNKRTGFNIPSVGGAPSPPTGS